MPIFALPFPKIDPIAFAIGPLAIRWYALAYIAGILLGWLYVRRIVADDALWNGQPRPSQAEIDDFITWVTVGIVVGGRLGYVLFYAPGYFLSHPLEIFMLWQGGMSFHGGLLGPIVAMILFSRGRDFPTLTLFDLAASAAPIGLFFGRVANFINGELWGRVTKSPFGMVFPHAGPDPRHPSQIYEAALEGLVLFLVIRIVSHGTRAYARPGIVAGTFAIGYAIARIVVEFFREPDAELGYLATAWIPGGITMGQILSLPLGLAGLVLLLWSLSRRSRDPFPET